MEFLTAKQVMERPDGGLFKYVEVNGEFRFIVLDVDSPRHSSMKSKEENATSAGTINVRPDKTVMMEDSWSSSLNIGTSSEAWDRLEAALGTKLRGRWE